MSRAFSAVLFAPVLALVSAAPDTRAAPAVASPLTLGPADPLAEVRGALRDARLDDGLRALDARGADAPGLRGRLLERRGDEAEACALYAKDRSSPRGPAAALRLARCLGKENRRPEALAAWGEVTRSPLGRDPLVLGELAAVLDTWGESPVALAVALELPVATFDEARRAALGEALALLARGQDVAIASRALDRLLVEFGDTPAAGRARAFPLAKSRPPEDLPAALRRASALAERHESAAVIAALQPFALDDSAAGCEARLLVGKAWRKLRKYGAAQKQLDAVATRCDDAIKKKARYLAARVAWLSRSAGAVTQLRAFAEAWPTDLLTDDVLLWLGEVLAGKGDSAGAEAAWQRALDTFPDGDMAHELRFRLAWSSAQRGDVAGARALLDEAARRAGSRVDVADRALYWRARLALCPQLDDIDGKACGVVGTERATALGELVAFAQSRPAGWYGHLARLLVRERADAWGLATPELPSLAGARNGAERASLAPSAALLRNERFVLALALVEGGYDDEALLLLAGLGLPRDANEDRFVVALLFGRLGVAGAGHALLRDGGMALLPGRPSTESVLAWSLDWPRAHAAAIEPAADEHRVPRPLLFGLAREESAFDADVVSWAGAVGLCQLMPPTAADEAQALRLPVPTVDALKNPILNARLGGAHIGRRLVGMKHPMLAIAAYNAGPGGVAQWKPRGPLDAWVEQIPVEETRNYVKKVTGSWVTYAALDGNIDDVKFPLVLR